MRATAALLADSPNLSNAELLKRLTRQLGPAATREIMVTRFQRQVRDPAVRLLRRRLANGSDSSIEVPVRRTPERMVREKGARETSEAETSLSRGRAEDSHRARDSRNGTAQSVSARDLGRIDDELIEAFRLGVAADTRRDVVERFRELNGIRKRVRRRLEDA